MQATVKGLGSQAPLRATPVDVGKLLIDFERLYRRDGRWRQIESPHHDRHHWHLRLSPSANDINLAHRKRDMHAAEIKQEDCEMDLQQSLNCVQCR